MGLSGLLRAGTAWASNMWSSLTKPRQTAPAVATDTSDPAATAMSVKAAISAFAASTATHPQLQMASNSLRSALDRLTSRTDRVKTTTVVKRAQLAAEAAGTASRLLTVDMPFATLATTLRMNTQTATARSSASAIGLDQTTAGSQLSSGALGLDFASAEAAATLFSDDLGLDLTSPDAASQLMSALGVGLDVSSPETASTLSSSAAIGLDTATAQSASTLQSTAEMSTTVTAYGTANHSFAGSSSDATLTGTFTGTGAAAAATSLTIKLKNSAAALNNLVATAVKFDIEDQTGNVLFSFDGNLKSGQSLSLGASIGLSITFSAGSLVNGGSSTTTVSRNLHNVDTAAVFNNADANLRPRFDGGATVSAGSFTINGVSIAVAANDSINSVLAKITASAAGVTASVSGDKIRLTSTGNSEDAIVLAGDTSGFLAATKLSAATTATGNVRDDLQTLSKTSQFGAVTTGSFTINGVAISVNRTTDTLSSIVDRINGAGAGVTAAYDAAADRLVLTGTSNSEELITVSDSTGFLTAAKLSTGNTVRGNIRDDQQVLSKTAQFAGVASGSFLVNGVSIAVNRDTDSLESVLARITSSAADVTASYDADLDVIVLTGKTNSMDLITVSGDTTGLLAATHLSTANTVRGHLSEDTVAFSNLAQFSSVSNGSFVVDGQTIAVTTSDSIQSIVSKINSSGARVVAAFDAPTNQLSLTTTYDSEDDIAIGSDTSGLLAAAGISSADTVTGNIRDDQQMLAKTSQFGAVTSGTFEVNGVAIAVDVDADSVATLVTKINNAGAGVTATFDTATNTIELVNTAAGGALVDVGSDGPGFLALAGLDSANTVRGHLTEDQEVFSSTAHFGGVTDGSFLVNGVSIAVDADTDTLETIIDRVNASAAGVTASYDSGTDTLTFTPDTPGATLIIEADTSGLLAAVNVAEGAAGTHVNADGAFNGTGADDPLFDPGMSVQAGSFTVNGVTINVEADDTVNTVLARITASAAGVTATFDEASDTVTLESTTGDGAIAIGNDSSGFLAAAKLDGTAAADTVMRDVSAFGVALDTMTEYDDVVAGTITINGEQVAVDPEETTVRGLVAALNALASVSASVDEATGALTITAVGNGTDLTISDTSGMLAELGIDTGTIAGRPGGTGTVEMDGGTVRVSNARDVAVDAAAAIQQLNEAVAKMSEGPHSASFSRDLESELADAVQLLKYAGVQGLSVTTEGGRSAVNVDAAALAAGLDKVSDKAALLAGAQRALDIFSNRASAIAAAPAAPPPVSVSQIMSVKPVRPPQPAPKAQPTRKPAGLRAWEADPATGRTIAPAAAPRIAIGPPQPAPEPWAPLLDRWLDS